MRGLRVPRLPACARPLPAASRVPLSASLASWLSRRSWPQDAGHGSGVCMCALTCLPHPSAVFRVGLPPPPRGCRSKLHIKTDQYGEKTFTCTDHNCMLE